MASPRRGRGISARSRQHRGDYSPIVRLRAAALVGLAVALVALLGLPALAAAAPSAGSNNASVASGDHGQTVDPGRGATVARFARRMVGVPYVTAGATPGGVDCSGLTMLAYRKVGTRLGHYTGDQWNAGPHRYKVSQLRPGDLVFFFSDHHHVGHLHRHVAG